MPHVTHETKEAEPQATVPQKMKDDLDIVEHSFHWLHTSAANGIDQLKGDIEKSDEPDFVSQLLSGVLEIAIPAGAAAVGLRLATKFVPTGATNEIRQEFVKMLFEGGINTGIAKGRSTLTTPNQKDVAAAFITSQKKAVVATHKENQTRFLREGRHKVKTAAEARRLADACSEDHVDAAAQLHYAAARDAWVAYLAQTTYGARSKTGAVTKDSHDPGATTTNMSSEEARSRANQHAPGYVPSNAPALDRAIAGRDDAGVLAVKAELPAIDSEHGMSGRSKVAYAILNGVNSHIRNQYEGVPLAQANIPRVVKADVKGARDFVLNFNEQGKDGLLPTPSQRKWLEERALVGKPENTSKNPFERYLIGTQLLLEELVPSSIRKGIFSS